AYRGRHERPHSAGLSWPAMARVPDDVPPEPAKHAVSPLRATIAALCANLVGIGLARFGYTPLIPALVAAGWFEPSAAVYLGAANLAGYLAGALGARWLAARTGAATTLRMAMALTAASPFA